MAWIEWLILMARGPEGLLKNKVMKAVTELGAYGQNMYTPYVSGTPDHYYEGHTAQLWAEYKYDMADCTALQERWIDRARMNGLTVWVVTQHKGGWLHVDTGNGLVRVENITELARWIVGVVGRSRGSGSGSRSVPS